jgi:hypothetical protein
MKNFKLALLLLAALLFFLGGIALSENDEEKKPDNGDKPSSDKKTDDGDKPAAGKNADDDEDKPRTDDDDKAAPNLPPPGELSAADKATLEKLYKERLEREKKEYEGVPMASAQPKESAHYIVKCNSTPKVAQYYSDMMEALYGKLSYVFAQFQPDSTKGQVVIYRNNDEFMAQPGMQPGIGGFYRPDTRVLVTYHGKFGASGDTSTVLAHEGTHQFQHLIIKGTPQRFFSVPIWLIEGMAVIFEAAEINVKSKKVNLRGVSNDRLTSMQNMIRRGQNKPLMQVIQTPQAQFKADEYAHAGLLQYYMLFGNNKKLRNVYDNYLREAIDCACKGQPISPARFSALVEKYTKKSMAQLEEDWKKYVLGLKIQTFGKIVGANTFISDEFFFKFSTPSSAYTLECKKELNPGEVAFMTRGKDDKVRISVSAGELPGDKDLQKIVKEGEESKQKNKKEYDDFIQKNYQVYEEEGQGFRKVKDYEAYETFRKIKSDKSLVSKDLQKTHGVTISAFGRLYTFSMQCPYEKWADYKPEFEKLLENFSPYLPAGAKK